MSDTFPPPAPPPPPPVMITMTPPSHTAELRRHELSKARAEAWQAWVITVAIAVAGVLGATLLAVIVLQMAAM